MGSEQMPPGFSGDLPAGIPPGTEPVPAGAGTTAAAGGQESSDIVAITLEQGFGDSGFRLRDAQAQMIRAVAEALYQGGHLTAEAPTGTGKTFAYLIPLLLLHRRAIISTASRALQDQILRKDLPFICRLLHTDADYMVLKGFSNYLCWKRCYEWAQKYGIVPGQKELFSTAQSSSDPAVQTVRRVLAFADSEIKKIDTRDRSCTFGDVRSAFGDQVASEVTVPSDMCIVHHGKDCPHRDNCFVYLAREHARHADIVVINHSLFFSALGIGDDPGDAYSEPKILPKMSCVVFDEAHKLPEVGRQHLSLEFGTAVWKHFLRVMKSLMGLKGNALVPDDELLPKSAGAGEDFADGTAPGTPALSADAAPDAYQPDAAAADTGGDSGGHPGTQERLFTDRTDGPQQRFFQACRAVNRLMNTMAGMIRSYPDSRYLVYSDFSKKSGAAGTDDGSLNFAQLKYFDYKSGSWGPWQNENTDFVRLLGELIAALETVRGTLAQAVSVSPDVSGMYLDRLQGFIAILRFLQLMNSAYAEWTDPDPDPEPDPDSDRQGTHQADGPGDKTLYAAAEGSDAGIYGLPYDEGALPPPGSAPMAEVLPADGYGGGSAAPGYFEGNPQRASATGAASGGMAEGSPELSAAPEASPKRRRSRTGYCVALVRRKGLEFAFVIAPLEISGPFGKTLDGCRRTNVSVVMTSATLSVSNSFAGFAESVGMREQSCRWLRLPSVYDYRNRTALVRSADFPAADSTAALSPAERAGILCRMLLPLIDRTAGGILILTTTIRSGKAFQSFLEQELKRPGHTSRRIFSQWDRAPLPQQIDAFRRDGRAVLIGTSSLWQGVDVKGMALRLVIIDKLPFPVPTDPVTSARMSVADREYSSGGFRKIMLPEMLIALRQAAGRLMRDETDCGVVVIADPRAVTKSSYSRQVLTNLPDMRLCGMENLPWDLLEDPHGVLQDVAGPAWRGGAGQGQSQGAGPGYMMSD